MFLAFETPAGVLFLVDDGSLSILTFQGEEALVPWCDLVEFLLQVSVQRAQVFSRLGPAQLRRLAFALSQRGRETR